MDTSTDMEKNTGVNYSSPEIEDLGRLADETKGVDGAIADLVDGGSAIG